MDLGGRPHRGPELRERSPGAVRLAVLFDEAHHNVHTAGGRYRPFVDLIAAAGYAMTPNSSLFSAATFHAYDLLVIANAGPAAGSS